MNDDGPGIPAPLRSKAMSRGMRLDEAAQGHGLGLDIVGDIIAAWRGSWELGESPLGGLRVTIRLPAAQPAGRSG
ncbi:Sensor protein PhoQ [compost metagenome]